MNVDYAAGLPAPNLALKRNNLPNGQAPRREIADFAIAGRSDQSPASQARAMIAGDPSH